MDDKIIIRKKRKQIVIPFTEIKTLQLDSYKLVTSKGKVYIPYSFMVDLPIFFRLLQTKMGNTLSDKVNKKIELYIKKLHVLQNI